MIVVYRKLDICGIRRGSSGRDPMGRQTTVWLSKKAIVSVFGDYLFGNF